MVKVQAIEACEVTSKLKKEKNKEPAKNKNHKHDPANKHVDYEHFFVYCLIFFIWRQDNESLCKIVGCET